MHTESVKTPPEAVRVMASTELNRKLADAEVADIVAFLAHWPVPGSDDAAVAANARGSHWTVMQ